MESFLAELDDEKTLLLIQEECRPEPPRKRRLDSDIVWDALETHFALEGSSGTKLKEQGCTTDLKCLRDEAIRQLEVFDEDMLKALRRIVTAMNLPPYNSLKDWFTPVTKAAAKKWGDDHPKTKLFRKHMKSPEGQKIIRVNEANAGLYKRNANGLHVSYSDALGVVQNWIGSIDWEDRLLAVMAAIGPRKTAILDPRIKFIEAEQHDKRFWIKQIGVLKDKSAVNADTAVDDEDAEYIPGKKPEKPIVFGLTFKQVTDAIKYIRSKVDVKGLTRKEIGRKYGPDLVARVKLAFPGPAHQNSRLGTHFLRALYANVAHHFFSDTLGNSLTAFIANVLAHNSNSLATALAYQTLKMQWGLPPFVKADADKIIGELRVGMALLTEQVAELKRRLDATGSYEEQERRDVAKYLKPDGTFLELPLFARIGGRKMTIAEEDERVLGTARLLEDAGVKASRDNIAKRGIGGTTISKVRKRQKK